MGMSCMATHVAQHSHSHLKPPGCHCCGKGRFGEWECGHDMQMQRVSRVWGDAGRSLDGGSATKLLCLMIYKVAHLLIPAIARDVKVRRRSARQTGRQRCGYVDPLTRPAKHTPKVSGSMGAGAGGLRGDAVLDGVRGAYRRQS